VISFRYHLVSIIGIFLAIALGVVIGTSALNGAVVGDLRGQVKDLKASSTAQAEQNRALRAQAGNADLLAKSFGTKISGASLAKTGVVILAAPGTSSDLKDAVAAAVASAGGSVTGRIQLTRQFTDPQRSADIRSLATSGVHPVGLQLPSTDDAGTLAGSLLGFTLFGHGQATDLTQVLAGFTTLNMLKVEGGNVVAGRAVIVIAPGGMAKAAPAGQLLLSMTSQLGTAGGPTVVAGDTASAVNGGLIGLVRASSAVKQTVTTVDDADTALGQLTVAMATAETVAGRKGQFGTGADVDALVPGVGG
jgi:copper transport outer membrane protein MctB